MERVVRFAVLGLFSVSVVLALTGAAMAFGGGARAADLCDQYRPALTREAQAIYGLGAPIPALAGQMRQESGCRADVTAWDNGRGLVQFMDPTALQVARSYPELGTPDPYNPKWAMRALVRYNHWLYARVKGNDACERWAATFKGYNAGLGYVQRAQRLSPQPGVWFSVTEDINAGQSETNFTASRRYPRVILFKHQPIYAAWGPALCREVAP
jgi:membrane-bound lytic murein transglycosylase MltF